MHMKFLFLIFSKAVLKNEKKLISATTSLAVTVLGSRDTALHSGSKTATVGGIATVTADTLQTVGSRSTELGICLIGMAICRLGGNILEIHGIFYMRMEQWLLISGLETIISILMDQWQRTQRFMDTMSEMTDNGFRKSILKTF